MITFNMNGFTYVFDPNRIFTMNGVKQTLQGNGPLSDDVILAVYQFGVKILQLYQFDEAPFVVAIHNNSPNYSIRPYSCCILLTFSGIYARWCFPKRFSASVSLSQFAAQKLLLRDRFRLL